MSLVALAEVKRSSCLRRHVERQNTVPLVWQSHDWQRSQRTWEQRKDEKITIGCTARPNVEPRMWYCFHEFGKVDAGLVGSGLSDHIQQHARSRSSPIHCFACNERLHLTASCWGKTPWTASGQNIPYRQPFLGTSSRYNWRILSAGHWRQSWRDIQVKTLNTFPILISDLLEATSCVIRDALRAETSAKHRHWPGAGIAGLWGLTRSTATRRATPNNILWQFENEQSWTFQSFCGIVVMPWGKAPRIDYICRGADL